MVAGSQGAAQASAIEIGEVWRVLWGRDGGGGPYRLDGRGFGLCWLAVMRLGFNPIAHFFFVLLKHTKTHENGRIPTNAHSTLR